MNLKLEELLFLAEHIDMGLYGEVRNEDLLVYLEEEVSELRQRNMPKGIYQKFN